MWVCYLGSQGFGGTAQWGLPCLPVVGAKRQSKVLCDVTAGGESWEPPWGGDHGAVDCYSAVTSCLGSCLYNKL